MPRQPAPFPILIAALGLAAAACSAANPPAFTPLPTWAAPAPTLTVEPSVTPTAEPSPTVAPTPSARVTRGPYLQSMTSDSVIIVWDTDVPARGQVAYGAAAFDQRVLEEAPATHHTLQLTGLLAYTTYRYRAEIDGWPITPEYSFRTAVAPGTPHMRFAVFGDTRSGDEIHRRVAERVLALNPDFALHTGDLVAYGTQRGDWDRFFALEQPLLARVCLFPVLGNHEQDSHLYFDAFSLPGNEHWYSFDWGNARFVALQIDAIAAFGSTSPQYAWLESTLAANTQPWLIVVFHVPPYSSVNEDGMERAVRVTLGPLFERYGVNLVFNGHHHNYQRSLANGVTYIVTGGGGAELYAVTRPEPELQAHRIQHNLVFVDIQGDTLTGTALTPDGETLDTFSLTRR